MTAPTESPEFSWRMTMQWHDLLFAHWPVDPDAVGRALPQTDPPLELDLWEGRAWIGVVPFRMSGIRIRGLPPIPGTAAFPELNVRTYVTAAGRPGVWFFSLDATSKLAVRTARLTYHLPYFDAAIQTQKAEDEAITYRSRRTHRGAGPAELELSYRPEGPSFNAVEGTLEYWLTERYRLFAANAGGRLFRGEIRHRPWPLQKATACIQRLNMTGALGIHLPDRAPHLLFARDLDVRAAGLAPA